MTNPQKKRYIKFLEGLGQGCDKYIADNEKMWSAQTSMKRMRNKQKKRHEQRIAEISASSGYKKRKTT